MPEKSGRQPMDRLKTWGEAVAYTFATRPTWRNGPSIKTNRINTGHVTSMRGLSFPIKKLDEAQVNQILMELEDERQLSSSTLNRVSAAISTVLTHCYEHRQIDELPFRKLPKRKEGEHRLVWFTEDQVEQMALAAQTIFLRDDLADVIRVAAYTGLRRSELLTLKGKDVDLIERRIHVGGRPGFQTKALNYRCIPIADQIIKTLTRRVTDAGESQAIFGKDFDSLDQLRRAFNKVRNYVGLPENYVFHCLRHSFGTMLNDKGVPALTIKDLMGHKRIETTLRYVKVSDPARQHAIDALSMPTPQPETPSHVPSLEDLMKAWLQQQASPAPVPARSTSDYQPVW